MSDMTLEYKQMLVKQLKRYRIEKALTVQLLSDELNLSVSTVYAWLSERNLPYDISAARLESFLKERGYIEQ